MTKRKLKKEIKENLLIILFGILLAATFLTAMVIGKNNYEKNITTQQRCN